MWSRLSYISRTHLSAIHIVCFFIRFIFVLLLLFFDIYQLRAVRYGDGEIARTSCRIIIWNAGDLIIAGNKRSRRRHARYWILRYYDWMNNGLIFSLCVCIKCITAASSFWVPLTRFVLLPTHCWYCYNIVILSFIVFTLFLQFNQFKYSGPLLARQTAWLERNGEK